MINEDLREQIISELDPIPVLFDNPSFDNSIIGIDSNGRVVYHFNLMVDEMMRDENMSESDVVEFIDYNTIRTLPYIDEELRPIIVYELW